LRVCPRIEGQFHGVHIASDVKGHAKSVVSMVIPTAKLYRGALVLWVAGRPVAHAFNEGDHKSIVGGSTAVEADGGSVEISKEVACAVRRSAGQEGLHIAEEVVQLQEIRQIRMILHIAWQGSRLERGIRLVVDGAGDYLEGSIGRVEGVL
jgi:hypothetical protein